MSAAKRILSIVDVLARRGPMGMRAIAQSLHIPLGTVHRLLHELAEEGVIDRALDGSWELSFRLLEITSRQLERVALPQLARPYCERLAEVTRETVNLNLLSGLSGVCIDKVRGTEDMQLDLRIGARGPLHCGGAGKAMLAFLPPVERENVINGVLRSFTPYTITDAKLLRSEIKAIEERGYAIDNQEVVVGVYCVAVPILDSKSRPVGAISVTGPSVKQPGSEIEPLASQLIDACLQISRRLGYGGQLVPINIRKADHESVRD